MKSSEPPTPIGPAPPLGGELTAAVLEVARRLADAGVEWLATGSVGRVLSGGRGRPADLDLEVAGADIHRAAAALGMVAAVDDDGAVRSIRALGRMGPAEIDLCAELSVAGPAGRLAADFPLMRAWATPARLADTTLWAAPVEEALCRALARGDGARVATLAAAAPQGLRPAYVARRLESLSATARA